MAAARRPTNKPDQDCTHDELVEKLVYSRELYKQQRDKLNATAAEHLKLEQERVYFAEQLALVRREKEDLKEQLAAAGNDNRLIGMIGKAREQVAYLGQVIDAVGQILGGDQPMRDLPDHPLLNDAEEVATIAGTKVSWRMVADRRWNILDRMVRSIESWANQPSTADWTLLFNEARSSLLERIDLNDDRPASP